MTKEEAAYLAGVVDGEGTLGVTINKVGGSYFVPYLSITNTSEQLIQKVRQIIGEGSICKKKGKKSYYKDYFVFTLRSGGSRRILPEIIPFLVAKKKQGELLLELLSLILPHNRGYRLRDPERFKQCSLLASSLYELNKRSKPNKEKE